GLRGGLRAGRPLRLLLRRRCVVGLLRARALRLLLSRGRSLARGRRRCGLGLFGLRRLLRCLLLVSHPYVVLSIALSRSFLIVRIRAISRLARRRRAEFSSAPVA